ncbi:RNA polymerase subunit sigma24 [Thalassospira sp. HJ]|uniref:sigma-70 family RNA polymerase sigma factor n=1 Tax=Thalassospira sp. HJ TaxID=1616823 RepID=UPI0005CE4732|nr:sigma-70 family RNA polymerase sigma factor [Thalassospira sp. HJ]KJE34358.1 RNA polymerase subunit sigma24 [Thalassospira sp. HJ]
MGKQPSSIDIFVTHRRALLNYASSIVGSRAHAEDVVQEAWLRFDEASSGKFLEDSTSYLFRIVRNLAFDGQRRLKREGQVITDDDFEAAANMPANSAPSPEMVALYKDEYALVMEALAELPERTRMAFEMHRFGGAKLREIALALDISLPLAHRLVADALQHCKERLGWP